MPRYLLALSIGPVQDFIAAARRTRDLWFGSYMLSEVSRAAAKCLYDHGAELIFPAPKTPSESLKKQPGDSNALNIGNKLLAAATTDNPKKLLENAKDAAKDRWRDFAREAKRDIDIRQTIWADQINEVLEFYSAWILFKNDEDYHKLRRRLDSLLNARKNTRNFLASSIGPEGHGLPKSSLDGLRETVLPESISKQTRRRLNLSPGEQLDCPGLIKRIGGDAEQFTPISRIALDPWLRGLVARGIDLGGIRSAMEELVRYRIVSRVTGNHQCYDTFPFDGQLLYPTRLEVARAELNRKTEEDPGTTEEILKKLYGLEKAIKSAQVYNIAGEPLPYMAILVADGDRMGELLDRPTDSSNHHGNLDFHRLISSTLADFAVRAPDTVREYRGHCIYAGGDDILALMPLDQAIGCAKALEQEFNAAMRSLPDIREEQIPTLSVGLGISHFIEPMGKQLDLARRAEKLAKGNDLPKPQQKNALGIILRPRSGAEIVFRERWTDQPETILQIWIDAQINGLLPQQTGYNLREESVALNWCGEKHDLIEAETRRILEQKRAEFGETPVNRSLIEKICTRAVAVGMAPLADELILTRRFAIASGLARGKIHIDEENMDNG